MNDPYKVLGVSPTATDDEITKAYRKLNMLHKIYLRDCMNRPFLLSR